VRGRGERREGRDSGGRLRSRRVYAYTFAPRKRKRRKEGHRQKAEEIKSPSVIAAFFLGYTAVKSLTSLYVVDIPSIPPQIFFT
jgi:hypothetical protein